MQNKINIKSMAIGAALGAVIMLSVAAATTQSSSSVRPVTEWEYKVGASEVGSMAGQETFLNDQAKQGWIFIQNDGQGRLYFKRAKK